jgi:hypothetical protein
MSTEFKPIDPTYLRIISDGLDSGVIHQNNSATLPAGLVATYEKALPPEKHVKDRQKFLDFFSAWALLKNEVSASFVAQLLGWTEKQVIDYLADHSSWFNSPVVGKFILYHERLRSFTLQKISHTHFMACNEAIIRQGQEALERRSGDEWEQYALEHLSTHLLIQAMEKENADALKALAYNTTHWNRQLEISKGFEWSKRMLNDMMLWASKFSDDDVIECALNKVDLYYQEQNDAPRIVEMVARNEMDTALQRIEAFGGNDREGLQRKFILYMLCLMELLFMRDKDADSKQVDKLCQSLQNQINIKFDKFEIIPYKFMFQLALKLEQLGIEHAFITDKLIFQNFDWIKTCTLNDDLENKVLLDIIRMQENELHRFKGYASYAKKLCELNKLDQALFFASMIPDGVEDNEELPF